MNKTVLALAIAVAAAAAMPFVFTQAAYADHCQDDQVILRENFTLPAEEALDSNLVVFGGNVAIDEGATLACSMIVFGGNVEISGAVDEDIVVFGGNTDLNSTAVVGGELVTFGGNISRAEGAQVQGGESQGFGPLRNRGDGRWFTFPNRFDPFGSVVAFYQGIFETVFVAIALGLLALLVVLFWPEQTARVSAAVTSAPGAAGGLGVLTAIAVPVLIGLLAITICLAPVGFVGALLFVTAAALGWLSLGMLVGARLTAALKLYTLGPAVSAAIGTFLLTLVASVIWQVPCVGWVVPVVLGSVGLGAVTLTRFGTRPYLPNLPAQPMPPMPPAEAGEAMTPNPQPLP